MSRKLMTASKMARKSKNSRADENYYIVFDMKCEKREEITEALLQLGYHNNKHLYFWPEDLLCSIGFVRLPSIHADIIHALTKKTEGIKNILKPNKKKIKEWEDDKMTLSDEIIENVKMNNNGIKYVKGSDYFSSALILRIDSAIDPKCLIRKTINDLSKDIENIEQAQQLQGHVEMEEISGDDSQVIQEDIGQLPEVYKMSKIEEKPMERAYHPPQICLANDIVERIKAIYQHYHKTDMLSRFKKFDFLIYTVNINMLEDQTWLRLSRKESECFPDSSYEGSDGKAREMAKEKVFKYNTKTVGRHKDLQKEVRNNPTTLFLFVADEAHWGATKSTTNGESSPHSELINKWNSEDHPNVILLLVTATPYNLLSETSRLPTNIFFKKDKDKFIFIKENEDEKMITEGFKMLHRVRWTESFRIKIEEGIIVKLKVPIHGKEGFAQLYVKNPCNEDNFLPWNGQHSSGDNHCISEFLMKAHENYITLSTIDEKWTLSVNLSVKDEKVGFIHNRKQNYVSNFCLINTFGEGLLILMVTLQNNKKLLAYDEASKRIELIEMPSVFGLEYDVPPLNSSFLLEECRPAKSSGSVREYISVNYYINSMRNNEISDQLIRNDPNFEEMVEILKKGGRGLDDDFRTSEYSYFIIIINAWRNFPFLFENISECFKNILQCAKHFQEKRTEYISKFKDELEKEKSQEIRPVDVKRFEDILKFYEENIDKDFKDDLKQFQNIKSFSGKHAEDLMRSGILCLLHLDEDKLQDVQKDFDKTSQERKKEFYSYADKKNFLCSDIVKKILQASETGRIIDNLIPQDLNKLNGTMNIIRTASQKTGNQLYKTLCIARRISSIVDYSFEILRDFSNAKLTDDFNERIPEGLNETTARYRLRERLQPKRCTYIDEETFTSCQCIFKDNEQNQLLKPTMKCRECKHVHKKIESYEDLDGLPCILILIQKGRLGDTFPPSMNALDLRLCNTRRTRSFFLSQFVQEIGRLCRYQNKSKTRLPYALTSTNTADILRGSIQGGATYFSVIGSSDRRAQLDPKLRMERKNQRDQAWERKPNKKNIARPTKMHYDYDNTHKHVNRILLGAEPQIGKTGVYLKVISLLQRLFSSTKEYDEEEMDEEEEEEDISDETDDLEEKNEKCKWIYPYWKDIRDAKNIVKRVNYGKYTRLYGIYEHKKGAPEIIPRSIFEKKPEKKKRAMKNNSTSQTSRSEMNKFKLFNSTDHTSCTECSLEYESSILDIILRNEINGQLEETHFRLSVPRTLQYLKLSESVKPYTKNEENDIDTAGIDTVKTSDAKTLNSWIFIPSYNRYNRANVNMHHTMVHENDGHYEPCFYTVIIAVRSSDFEAYCKLWQSMYAVLQIPDKLSDTERDAMSGGIGFARRCIQVFAESLNLKWIFMLDDNIRYVYEIEESDSEVKRDDGKLIEKSAPLFKVLKHLEKQVDDSEKYAPEQDFEKYPKTDVDNPLEEYTGPSRNYGVIGLKKHSPTIRQVKAPFTKTHVYSFVFLNINVLKERNIKYNTWGVFEDLSLNNDCDDKGLWVIKYNRFTVWKQHMKTWVPKMYIWNEDTLLNEVKTFADNSFDILVKYLKAECTIKKIIRLCAETPKDTNKEFENFLANFQDQNGRHTMIAILDDPLNLEERLKEFFDTPSNFHNGDNYIVIVMTSCLCIHARLDKKVMIQEWLKKVISQNFKFEIITSHNPRSFDVKVITIIVQVNSRSSIAVAESNPSTSSYNNHKRSSDENKENVKKILKVSDENVSNPSSRMKDEQLREDAHQMLQEMSIDEMKKFMGLMINSLKPTDLQKIMESQAKDKKEAHNDFNV